LGFGEVRRKKTKSNGHIFNAFRFLLREVEAGLFAVNLYFFPLHFLNVAMPQTCERREQGGAFE
jgi:hypothetical protein